MKDHKRMLCALTAVFMLTGCGDITSGGRDTEDEDTNNAVTAVAASSENDETSLADDAISSEETEDTSSSEAEAVTTKVSADSSKKTGTTTVKAAETSEAESQSVPDGTGGHAEDELYKLYGWWYSSENDDYIHICDASFEASINGAFTNGHLEYADKDGIDCFMLSTNSTDFPLDTFVFRDVNKHGRLKFFNNGLTTEFIERSDFDVRFIRAEEAANGYDGEPLSSPITIEFTAKEDIRDLTLLKLDLYDYDEISGSRYNYIEQLSVPSIDRGGTFEPTVEIPETVPKFGIRYRDIHGTWHCYDISMSGRDGSILLTPFVDQG